MRNTALPLPDPSPGQLKVPAQFPCPVPSSPGPPLPQDGVPSAAVGDVSAGGGGGGGEGGLADGVRLAASEAQGRLGPHRAGARSSPRPVTPHLSPSRGRRRRARGGRGRPGARGAGEAGARGAGPGGRGPAFGAAAEGYRAPYIARERRGALRHSCWELAARRRYSQSGGGAGGGGSGSAQRSAHPAPRQQQRPQPQRRPPPSQPRAGAGSLGPSALPPSVRTMVGRGWQVPA